MAKKWIMLCGAVLIVGLVVLAAVFHHFQLKAAEDHYRAELKTRGELLNVSQMLPPPVPAAQNCAGDYQMAFSLLETNETVLSTNTIWGMKMVAPGKAMIVCAQPEFREPGKYGFTNAWSDMERAVDQNAKVLQLLREILAKPELDFHIPYTNGFEDPGFFNNVHLADLRRSASFAISAGVVDLHRGNSANAVTNTRVALSIANAMENQRMVISELIRIAIANEAQGATWGILESDGVTDSELASLQRDWERINFSSGFKNALAMEQGISERMLARWRSSNAEFQKYFDLFDGASVSMGASGGESGGMFQRLKLYAQMYLWRYWWSYADELRNLHGTEVLVETAHNVETNAPFGSELLRQQSALGDLKLGSDYNKFENPILFLVRPDLQSILSESVTTLSGCLKKVATAESMRELTVTAIALKRFELRHGHYPVKLSELVSDFLSAAPLDPVDGGELRYRRNATGTFTLYSIGMNGKDDGGDPTFDASKTTHSMNWLDSHARDWVWPQPATEVEIKKYFDDQSIESK